METTDFARTESVAPRQPHITAVKQSAIAKPSVQFLGTIRDHAGEFADLALASCRCVSLVELPPFPRRQVSKQLVSSFGVVTHPQIVSLRSSHLHRAERGVHIEIPASATDGIFELTDTEALVVGIALVRGSERARFFRMVVEEKVDEETATVPEQVNGDFDDDE